MKILTKKMRLNPEIDFDEIVKMTPGYVGADISTLCKEASIQAVTRIVHELGAEQELSETTFIDLEDFRLAAKRV